MSGYRVGSSGFSLAVSGRIVFVRHYGTLTCELATPFVEAYTEAIRPLQVEPWGEVIDLSDAIAMEPGRNGLIGALFDYQQVRNNVATAYVLGPKTCSEHVDDLQQIYSEAHAPGSDQFFDDYVEALNWVNQRLAL